MNSRAINYQDLKSLYHQKGIFFINYQICDNFADLTDKALGGADLLNRMIQKFQVSFIFLYFFINFFVIESIYSLHLGSF